jgi:hypothetical protein
MMDAMGDPVRRLVSLDEVVERIRSGESIELIGGAVVPREAARVAHGLAQSQAAAALGPFNGRSGGSSGPGGWWIPAEVEVTYAKTAEVYRHDLVGFRRDRLAKCPTEWPVRDRPDWACEILSPSTARFDVVKKQRTLHEHGVPHYWLLDPDAQTLVVYRHGPDGYVNVLSAAAPERVHAEPFGEIELDLDRVLGAG